MKSGNFRLANFNAGLQMLARAFQAKKETALVNRQLRQEKRKKHMASYPGSGCGESERERRVRQMRNGMNCGQGNFR